MKYLSILFLAVGFLTLSSCGEDDPVVETFDYEIMIMQPNTDDKNAGDSIHIHVNFDEADLKTVHHMNVTLKNASNGTIVYSKPDVAHVHEESGHYEHHDDFVLNVAPNTDWILEAKVWGHEAGVAEATRSIEFHIN